MKKISPHFFKHVLLIPFIFLAFSFFGCKGSDSFLQKAPPDVVTQKTDPNPTILLQNSISGHVTDATAGIALVDTKIEIINAVTGLTVGWARTNTSGDFVLNHLNAGNYAVRISMVGFSSFESSQKVLENGASWVVNASLIQSPNTVIGRITNSVFNTPVDTAQVQIFNSQTGALVQTVNSNSNGQYSISNLPAGTYKLSLTKIGYFDFQSTSPGAIRGGITTTVDVVMIPKKVTILGRAFESVTQNNLAGVTVNLISTSGGVNFSAVTAADGSYSVTEAYAGIYRATASKTGFDTFETSAPGTVVGGNSYTVDFPMKTQSSTVFGKVVDASNIYPIANAKVRLINFTTGAAFAEVYTDSNGHYTISQVPAATYRMVFSADHYSEFTTTQPGALAPGQSVQVDAALSRSLDAGQFRIVLTWTGPKAGAVRDVDSYLLIPGIQIPISYSNKNSTGANLDVDNTEWLGPETVTISNSIPGVYHYYVVNYNTPEDKLALGNSDIVVNVYSTAGLQKQYKLNGGSGVCYEFFTIQNGTIHDANQFCDTKYPYSTGGGGGNHP